MTLQEAKMERASSDEINRTQEEKRHIVNHLVVMKVLRKKDNVVSTAANRKDISPAAKTPKQNKKRPDKLKSNSLKYE